MSKQPNILVTGTPGTGKSTLCELIASESNGRLTHIELGKLVKEKSLHDGYNEEFDTYMLDEDLVCDELEPRMAEGGCLLEAHSCDYFPERWFQAVVCLRADNTVLYDRLAERNYSQLKISENIEAEIMQVCLDEVAESYAKEITIVAQNDNIDQLQATAAKVIAWLNNPAVPISQL